MEKIKSATLLGNTCVPYFLCWKTYIKLVTWGRHQQTFSLASKFSEIYEQFDVLGRKKFKV